MILPSDLEHSVHGINFNWTFPDMADGHDTGDESNGQHEQAQAEGGYLVTSLKF